MIGRDGRGSLVRKRAGLELELLPEQYDVLWFKLPAPKRLREGCRIVISVVAREHPAIFYTSWNGRLQYGLVMPEGGLKEIREKGWIGQAVRSAPSWLAEREPEIVRSRKLQRREAWGQGDARSGSWRFGFARRAARLVGRYRWAQNAWLKRQHDLRFGSTEVRLKLPRQNRTPEREEPGR